MSETTISVLDNGPLRVKGAAELVDGAGKPYAAQEEYYLCRCGFSGNRPFCDGSHKGRFESSPRSANS